MKKLKVLTVIGTRPEIIRLSCVLQKLGVVNPGAQLGCCHGMLQPIVA